MGAVPPEESMRMLDQINPVEICTEATFPRAMLSSLLPNRRDFIRLTCCGVTMIRTGKNRLPLVQRLAVKVSEVGRFGIAGYLARKQKPCGALLGWAGGTSAPTQSDPLQGAFLPDPDVAHDQDEQENEHFDQSECAERLELHCPWEKEDSFYVEYDKEDGDDVITNSVAPAGAVDRINTALVGHQFRLAGIVGAHQFCRQQRDRNQNSDESDEDENRNVVLRHRTPLTSLPATLESHILPPTPLAFKAWRYDP